MERRGGILVKFNSSAKLDKDFELVPSRVLNVHETTVRVPNSLSIRFGCISTNYAYTYVAKSGNILFAYEANSGKVCCFPISAHPLCQLMSVYLLTRGLFPGLYRLARRLCL